MAGAYLTNLFGKPKVEPYGIPLDKLSNFIMEFRKVNKLENAWLIGDYLTCPQQPDLTLELVVPDNTDMKVKLDLERSLAENMHPDVKVYYFGELNGGLETRPYAKLIPSSME